jgi:hypothetical protein
MNRLFLSLLLLCLAGRLTAETLPERYAKYGDLIIVKLDSAPFPHPDRAKGHKYGSIVYTQEKNYSDNSVAIFVPKGFRRTDHTDFVVHFYGWRHHIENTLSNYNMIEQFSASGRNAILVIPTTAYDAADSFAGKMEDTNGFMHLMNDVVATLQSRGVIETSTIGKIIITGHSGGGDGALYSIVTIGGDPGLVKEVWLFDAFYGGLDQYLGWLKKYPDRRIVDIYTEDGGTKRNTDKLMAALKASNPPIPFLAKNEEDVTAADLKKNRLVFIFTKREHDHVVQENNEYCQYLKTSGLSPLKVLLSPRMSSR